MSLKRAVYILMLCTEIVFGLSACVGTGFNTQQYTVKSGDTLYFVAWKYKVDADQLARWNNLSKPYTIYPGDQILINPNGMGNPPKPSRRQESGVYIVQRGDTLYAIGREVRMSPGKIARINGLTEPYTIYPGQRLQLDGDAQAVSAPSASQTASSTTRRSAPVVKSPSRSSSASPSSWQWPAKGTLSKTYKGGNSTQQGIDIVGREGDPISAAAAGTVVYSGGGLINYGQLVIVKHSDAYLSAYGYNRKLLVKEGDKVKQGQAIAEMGRMAQDKPTLHFEIRKYGKPVNPMNFLPDRS